MLEATFLPYFRSIPIAYRCGGRLYWRITSYHWPSSVKCIVSRWLQECSRILKCHVRENYNYIILFRHFSINEQFGLPRCESCVKQLKTYLRLCFSVKCPRRLRSWRLGSDIHFPRQDEEHLSDVTFPVFSDACILIPYKNDSTLARDVVTQIQTDGTRLEPIIYFEHRNIQISD